MNLDPVQLRVLGALIEKEITTPENYPLSLNSLISACNQRSSRDPVLDLSEDEVRQAVHTLEERDMVTCVRDARVPKYEHRIRTVLNLRRDETAIICLLILRGPQTPGELRGRAERMFSFEDIAAVQTTLERLAARSSESDPSGSGSLVVQLPRQSGSRESRYIHLLGTMPQAASGAQPSSRSPESAVSSSGHHLSETESIIASRLEARLDSLTIEIAELRSRVSMLEDKVQ